MWVFTLLEVSFVLTANLLPPILDVGVQVWNGITINQMEFNKNKEWSASSKIPGDITIGTPDQISRVKPENGSCLYEGNLYKDNEDVPSNDRCYVNYCNGNSGNIHSESAMNGMRKCLPPDEYKFCLPIVPEWGECCPENYKWDNCTVVVSPSDCLEDGVLYENGAIIPSGPCQKVCYCLNGEAHCNHIPCDPAPVRHGMKCTEIIVDEVNEEIFIEGECCPVFECVEDDYIEGSGTSVNPIDSINLPDNKDDSVKFPDNTNDFIKFPNDTHDSTNFPKRKGSINLLNETDGSSRERRNSERDEDVNPDNKGSKVDQNTKVKEKDESNPAKHVAFHLNISKEFQFVITYEALITIALLQLPALCLAIWGMIRAFQKERLESSPSALTDVLKASLLVFTPFFLVQVFSVFEFQFAGAVKFICDNIKWLVGLVCGKGSETWLTKLDLLHFLPKEKGRRLLCVEVTKIFFGSCIQLCFQATILFGYTEPGDITLSQIISIVASTLVISKTGIDAILFQRENESPTENIINFEFLYQKLTLLKTILIHLPLVFSSAVFHMGTLVMVVLVWEWYSIIYITFVFIVSLFLFTSLPMSTIHQTEQKLHLTRKSKCKEDSRRSQFLKSLYLSWANLFVLTRPIQQLSIPMHATMSTLSLLHFIINIVTLLGLLAYTEITSMAQTEFYESSLMLKLRISLALLVIVGFVNILLVILHMYQVNWAKKIKTKDGKDNELVELVEKTNENLPVIIKEQKEDNTEIIMETTNENETNENVMKTKIKAKDGKDHELVALVEKTNEKFPDVNKEQKEDITEIIIETTNDDESNENVIKTPSTSKFKSNNKMLLNETEIDFLGKTSNLTKEEIKESFEELLSNSANGMVDKTVFKTMVHQYSPTTDANRLEEHVFKAFDEENTGEIELSKFKLVMYALSNGPPKDTLKQIFKIVDVDNNAGMTVEELKQVVHEIFLLSNEKIPPAIEKQLVDKAFGEMRKKEDGSVTIDEFVQTCLRHNFIIINYIKNFPEAFCKNK